MAENVRVIVRCRPMNKRERDLNSKCVVDIDKCSVSLANPKDAAAPAKMFTFDSAYGPAIQTEAIYNDICYSLVESVLEGYNSTVFAYGQTGCGKSHTMQGSEKCIRGGIGQDHNFKTLEPERENTGIISRAFEHIFEAVAVSAEVRFLALVSFLEIYNENIRDLLTPNNHIQSLQLKELPGEGVIVQDLSTHPVSSIEECEQLLEVGAKNRIVGATLMNAGSSRSHSIFTISLEQISTALQVSDVGAPLIKRGKLNLVDLAGSERQAKTGATGDRLKEATKINLSLSALGNVISALVDGRTKHVPYRDSKLTRLLQDSLGGNTKTLMVACISPADYSYDETLSTLRYASRAKSIHNKPRVNEDPKDTMLREYQREILQLRQLLDSGSPKTTDLSTEWLEIEKAKLRAQFESETKKLKTEHEAQQIEKQELVRDMDDLRRHYEEELARLAAAQAPSQMSNSVNKEEHFLRLKEIRANMIGGERAHDARLKEKRTNKKLAAQRRLSALEHALSRVEQSEDRDLLQGQYRDIQQELQAKCDALKAQRQKVRGLEREILDLQGEFQRDRSDYLETIRKLEKNLKFHEQLVDKAMPLLRKDGRLCDPEIIRSQSVWNDDLKKWRLPEDPFSRVKLPPAETRGIGAGRESTSLTAPGRLESAPSDGGFSDGHGLSDDADSSHSDNDDRDYLIKKLERSEREDIAGSYFKPRRAAELLHQSKAFNSWKVAGLFSDYASRNKAFSNSTLDMNAGQNTSRRPATLSQTWSSGLDHSPGNHNDCWLTGPMDTDISSDARAPVRLDLQVLPSIGKNRYFCDE